MPSDANQPPSRRVRIKRKLTLTERLSKRLNMPHLTRWKRNERIAIVVIFVLAVVYFVMAPLIDRYSSRGSSQNRPAAGGSGPPAGKPKADRPDRRGG